MIHTPKKHTPQHVHDKSAQRIDTKERNNAYIATLTQARTHMRAPQRIFSQIIHMRAIEIASDFVGGTIVRPNAILYGSLASLVATFILYFAAKYFGYPLSGAESIAAFIIGWATGIIIDYTKTLARGSRS